MQEHRQKKRWPTIQADPTISVKGQVGDLLSAVDAPAAFPILAIAPSPRHAGIVCLDDRLKAIVARARRLRDLVDDSAALTALAADVRYELDCRAPRIVVIERAVEPRRAPLTDRLAERVVAQAREAGVRIITLSFVEACERISSGSSARSTAHALISRYAALGKRLAPRGVPLLRHERWREAKPLVTAFALAHAVGLDVLASAARPLGLGPPPETL